MYKIAKIYYRAAFFIMLFSSYSFTQLHFVEHPIDLNYPGMHDITTYDLDKDGDKDIIGGAERPPGSTTDPGISWWRNDGGNPIRWTRFRIDSTFSMTMSVNIAFVDNDTFPDIIATSWDLNQIAWWKNCGNPTTGWIKYIVKSSFRNAHDAECADINNDGYNDVIGVCATPGSVIICYNNGLNPPGWTTQTISNTFTGGKAVSVVDLDKDDDLDIVGAADEINCIRWWENTGGNPITWIQRDITTTETGAASIEIIDMNKDSVYDILCTAWRSNVVSYWICNDLFNNQWSRFSITNQLPIAGNASGKDLDHDGDYDVVATGKIPGELSIYYNDNFSWSKTRLKGNYYGCAGLSVDDMDNDGDSDIVASASGDGDLIWWENAASFSVVPTSIVFGSILAGSSKTDSVTVKNNGMGSLTIDSVKSDNSEFTALPTSGTIAQSDSQKFYITFRPTSHGSKNGNIIFWNNSGTSPDAVVVTGNGIAPVFSVKPMTVALGYVLVSSNKTDSIIVKNTGGISLIIDSVKSNNSEFTILPTSGTIAQSDSQKFYITFSPTSLGLKNGNIIFWHNSVTSPDSVTVSGIGSVPVFSVTPLNVTFGNILVGSNKTDSITVINTGGISLIIDSVKSDNSEFSALPTSGTIAQSDSQKFYTTFSPTSSGLKNGTIIFWHNSSTSPDSVAIVGIGETYVTVTIQVSSHWNIMSLPIVPLDDSVHQLFPNSVHSVAYSFDGIKYNREERLQSGAGYWLKFSDTEVVALPGYPLYKDTIQVREGWNLIGSLSLAIDVSLVTSNPPNMITSSFFGYNQNYFVTDTIKPGKGYWVKVNQAGVLILSSFEETSLSKRIKIISNGEKPPPPPDEESSEVDHVIPSKFLLYQSYPNPFNPETNIRFDIPVRSHVQVEVYNVLGSLVRILLDDVKDAGSYSITWDGTDNSSHEVSTGLYYYQMKSGNFYQVQKGLLIK